MSESAREHRKIEKLIALIAKKEEEDKRKQEKKRQ
jgi:hypothetical protein